MDQDTPAAATRQTDAAERCRIWAIADLHLSFAQDKPMHVFGEHWRDHPEKIAANCQAVVEDSDILLLPGDLSWAMKRKDAEPDLAYMAALPGVKVLCKGNHDYWWDSDRPVDFPGLHDTPYISSDGRVGIAGTRGWEARAPTQTDAERGQWDKIVRREVGRLEKRLNAIKDCPIKLALIHYPPLDEFLPLLRTHNIETVLYGHLHLNGRDHPLPERWHGLRALCVAADRLHFMPRLIATLD